MAITRKTAKRLLSHEEWELVESTYIDGIHKLDDKALADARTRLRKMRSKERDSVAHLAKVARGKAEPRGGAGNIEKPRQRKQVFANAMQRLNKESRRRRVIEARETIVNSQKRALAAKRSAARTRPKNTRTANRGPSNVPSSRDTVQPSGMDIGAIAKDNARAQAKRDNR